MGGSETGEDGARLPRSDLQACITEHGQPETQISQSDVKMYQVNANNVQVNDQGDTWMGQPALEAYHQSSI